MIFASPRASSLSLISSSSSKISSFSKISATLKITSSPLISFVLCPLISFIPVNSLILEICSSSPRTYRTCSSMVSSFCPGSTVPSVT